MCRLNKNALMLLINIVLPLGIQFANYVIGIVYHVAITEKAAQFGKLLSTSCIPYYSVYNTL